MITTQVHLTTDESEGLARVAAATGRNQSEVIREAIDQYLIRLGTRDRLSRLREGCGIWADREISLEGIRKDFDRY